MPAFRHHFLAFTSRSALTYFFTPRDSIFLLSKALTRVGSALATTFTFSILKAKKSLNALFTKSLNRKDLFLRFPWRFPTRLGMWREFRLIVDELAAEAGSNLFLEKTPEHIYHIEQINKLLPESKFIHVLRDGLSVVNSLLRVSHEFPTNWGGKWNVDYSIRRWNEAITISEQYLIDPQHKIVSYEELLNDPEKTTNTLCDFLNIPREKGLAEKAPIAAQRLAPSIEPHKQENLSHYLEFKARPIDLEPELVEYVLRRLKKPLPLKTFL
jgi:hypothetical protein